MTTKGKVHTPEAVRFDSLCALDFGTITLGPSIASTTLSASRVIPGNFKCFFIGVNLTGTAAGTCSVNVVAGAAAEAGIGGNGTALTTGQQLLTADTAVTMTVNAPQRFQCAVPDAFFDGTLVATVRLVTNASATTTEYLQVTMYGKFVDPNPQEPLYNVAGNATF